MNLVAQPNPLYYNLEKSFAKLCEFKLQQRKTKVILRCVILFMFIFEKSPSSCQEIMFHQSYPTEFPEIVIFDWDNTITNSWPMLLEVMNKTLIKHDKKPFSMEEFRSLPNINMPQAEIIAGIFGEERPDVVETYWRVYKDTSDRSPLVVDEFIEPLLKYLKEKKVYVAVLSNQEQAVLEGNVTKSGLKQYFDKVVGAIRNKPEKNKPSVGAIKRVLERTNLKLEDNKCWMVGDGDSDMKTALNNHLFPVWVSAYAIKEIPFTENVSLCKALKVESLKELFEFIKTLANCSD